MRSVTSPLIILSSRQALLRWFDHLNDERIAISDTGFINDQLVYQWIKYFRRATRDSVGPYRLLLCDGFGSHLTYEVVKFCEKNRILLFFLPAHSSYLLEPLDVGVFHIYKHPDEGYTHLGR